MGEHESAFSAEKSGFAGTTAAGAGGCFLGQLRVIGHSHLSEGGGKGFET